MYNFNSIGEINMAFRSNKDLYRHFGVLTNSKTKVFHSVLRAGNESDFVINKEETQMWHKSTPEKVYNILISGYNTGTLERFRTINHSAYISNGFEQADAHHDERLVGIK
jgi:hypothetical protein